MLNSKMHFDLKRKVRVSKHYYKQINKQAKAGTIRNTEFVWVAIFRTADMDNHCIGKQE